MRSLKQIRCICPSRKTNYSIYLVDYYMINSFIGDSIFNNMKKVENSELEGFFWDFRDEYYFYNKSIYI